MQAFVPLNFGINVALVSLAVSCSLATPTVVGFNKSVVKTNLHQSPAHAQPHIKICSNAEEAAKDTTRSHQKCQITRQRNVTRPNKNKVFIYYICDAQTCSQKVIFH